MEVERHDHGVPSWVDLGAPDPAAAAAFYGSLFGWDAPEGPPETGGYRMATLRGRAVAGIGPAQAPGPPWWTTYVTVDDADAIPAKAKAAGGGVLVEPFDVMTFGRMAVITDTTGAAISVWQAMEHPGAHLVNEPGTYSWSELITSDVEAAKGFYAAVLGWGEETNPGYTEFKVGGRSIAGMMARPPGMPAQAPDAWGVYFAVADHDATVAQVLELGGQRIVGPMTVPVGTFSVVVDPQGAVFNVIQLSGARP
jgi:uncharacterized protein